MGAGGAMYMNICVYVYTCIHRGKERESIMKGGGVHGGFTTYIYIYTDTHMYRIF